MADVRQLARTRVLLQSYSGGFTRPTLRAACEPSTRASGRIAATRARHAQAVPASVVSRTRYRATNCTSLSSRVTTRIGAAFSRVCSNSGIRLVAKVPVMRNSLSSASAMITLPSQ